MIADILQDPGHELLGQFGFGSFPAPDHDGHLDLVSLLQKPGHVLHLEIVIMDADLRPELDLFELDVFLVFLGFVLFFVLFVKKLSIIHDPADRGVGLRGDLDEVEAPLAGQIQGLRDGHDTHLFFLFIDHSNLFGPNHFIDPMRLRFPGYRIERSSSYNARPP